MAGSPYLRIYLNDHLLGASAGVSLFRRATRGAAGTPRAEPLGRMTAETEADLASLTAVMRALGVPVSRLRPPLGRALELVGRLKLNGSLASRSPLSDLVELEGLRLGVLGKQCGWLALRAVADDHPALDPVELDRLADRASRQAAELERLREGVARTVLG